jgi:diacylglycerol kinase family enzyme
MRAAIIINPRSGLRKTHDTADGSRRDRAMRWAGALGVDAEVTLTSHAGHGRELAAQFAAAGFDRVVAWGGDGTVNEAAGPLFGTATAFGIIPGGSGDGLARSLKLPRHPESALRVALTGDPRPMDIGWLAGRHFLNIAGLGFDAEVAVRFNRRSARGTRGYLSESLTAVWNYPCCDYRVRVEGQEFAGPHFLLAFANGREYGSGLVIAPQADPFDGWFDMVLVSGGGPLRQFWRARRLAFRRMQPAEGIWRQRIRSASISGKKMFCHVDGETFEAEGDVELRLEPSALRIISA